MSAVKPCVITELVETLSFLQACLQPNNSETPYFCIHFVQEYFKESTSREVRRLNIYFYQRLFRTSGFPDFTIL